MNEAVPTIMSIKLEYQKPFSFEEGDVLVPSKPTNMILERAQHTQSQEKVIFKSTVHGCHPTEKSRNTEWIPAGNFVVHDDHLDDELFTAVRNHIWIVKRTVDRATKYIVFVTDGKMGAHTKIKETFITKHQMVRFVRTKCKLSRKVRTFAELTILKRKFMCLDPKGVTLCLSTTIFGNNEEYKHCSLSYEGGSESHETFSYLKSELGIVPGRHPVMEYLSKRHPEVYNALMEEKEVSDNDIDSEVDYSQYVSLTPSFEDLSDYKINPDYLKYLDSKFMDARDKKIQNL
jgi:hypothetical protein